MIGKVLKVLDLLLAIEHLPTLDAENFSIRLQLDRLELGDEVVPFGRVTFDHECT